MTTFQTAGHNRSAVTGQIAVSCPYMNLTETNQQNTEYITFSKTAIRHKIPTKKIAHQAEAYIPMQLGPKNILPKFNSLAINATNIKGDNFF